MPNGTHSNLFVFHQAISQGGLLWCSVLENHVWEADALTPKTGMAASPSALELDGKVYCFHQGSGADGNLYFNIYDGMSWEGDRQVPGSRMSEGPSVVDFGGRLYCFHQGEQEDGQLLYNIFDGSNWLGDQPVPNSGMSKSPSAVVFNGRLYCFYQGSGENGELRYNVFDGAHWSAPPPVPRTQMSEYPGAVVFNGLLYCFHQGEGQNGELWYNVFNDTDWRGDVQVKSTLMSKSPSAAVLNGALYYFYQGYKENGELWYNVLTGTTWHGDAKVGYTGMSESPCAIYTDLPPVPSLIVTAGPSETRVGSYDGWGTSLCWWANQYGGVTGELGAAMLADLFFGTGNVEAGAPGKPPFVPLRTILPGLGMNVVRYNIGGGGGGATIDPTTVELISSNNPVGSPHYITGFWRKWGEGDDNVNNSQYWDWDADKPQRTILTMARDRGANIFEFFSNSPPWWMCDNHSSSGGEDLVSSNLQSWNFDQFAKYLATVVKRARDNWGIEVQYIEPFNEPTPGVWTIGPPANGVQEGCNFPIRPGQNQNMIINNLYLALEHQSLQRTVGIAVSDETSPWWALKTWGMLASVPGLVDRISKVNTHGYAGTPGHGTDPYRGPDRGPLRTAIRSRAPGVKIWMSEFGDGDISGMTMATSIMLDMTELQPSAWVNWQVIDPAWGFFAPPTEQDGGVIGRVYAKYYIFAQFSRHIRQGQRIIGNSDPNSIVAYDADKSKLVIVTLNLDRERWASYDLSAFSRVAGPVDRWDTTTINNEPAKRYQHATDTVLTGKAFRFRLEPNSVSTFEIGGVT
jgi:galactan endo-1,6-beta-galactosidase